MLNPDEIPDVTLVELDGALFDLSCPDDCQTLLLCLEALGEADKLGKTGSAA